MKVFVQIVNSRTGLLNCGMIEEPVRKGLEIDNALVHFGVNKGEITWNTPIAIQNTINTPIIKIGTVSGTDKIITVVTYE